MKTSQVTKELSFKGESIYLGLDVHKKQWTVSIMTDFKEHKTFVQPPDPAVLVKYVHEHFPEANYYSVYEAGFCGFWIDKALRKEGIQNIVVNPADVPTSDKEKRTKQDTRDSRKLCRELRKGDLKPIHVPSTQQQQDRELVRLRKRLVKDMSRCKNRIKGLLHLYGIEIPTEHSSHNWPKSFIAWLGKLELESSSGTAALSYSLRELEAISVLYRGLSRQLLMMASESRYKESIRLLRTIPGIGLVVALTVVTELGDINRFKSLDHLCSYVGLTPDIQASGDTQHVGRITPRKNIYLQSVLIQCAWQAASLDPVLLKAYHGLRTKMKSQKAIIRIARKVLNRIRFVLKTQQDYQIRMS
jgi:transposase